MDLKKLVILILLGFSTSDLFAKCANSGIEVWPKAGSIKPNSVFLIEGYAITQEVINGLNVRYPVYLKSENHKIKLKVKERFKGQFNLTQALLVPDQILRVNEVYEIVIENFEGSKPLKDWDEKLKINDNIKWRIEGGADTKKPYWLAKPIFKEKTYQELGCGPEIYVTFNCKVQDETEVLILTKIKSIDTGKIVTYILPLINNQILVGHGMCSGAFILNNSTKFEVEFSPMDGSGNIIPWDQKPIVFNSPIKNQ